MGLPLQDFTYIDNGGGVDLKSSPTKVSDDDASRLLNTDYSTDGAFFTRNGSTIMNVTGGIGSIPAQMAGAPKTLALFDYRKSDGTAVQVICAGTTIKQNMSNPTDMVTGLSSGLPVPDMEFIVTSDNEYLIWGNGVDENLKFDGTTWTNLSMPRPTAPVAIDLGVGALAAGDYQYYVSFARTQIVDAVLVVVQESELSPISNTVTIAVNREIRVTIPVCVETLLPGVIAQCNARIIYRVSPSSSGVAYRLAIVPDNVTTTYDDNTVEDGTIEAEFDNQAPPKSAIFEEYQGRINYVDVNSKTDLYESKAYKPWNVPASNFEIFDGPVQCVKRVYNMMLIGTDRSLWVREGALVSSAASRRLSSDIGILNNQCAVGKTTIYILATNRKIYPLRPPSDFSQEELRIDEPLSIRVEPYLKNLTAGSLTTVTMEYYTKADVAKVVISLAVGKITNDQLLILNETQSALKNKPVWQIWNNINASALKQFNINGNINLFSGDYNGFIWKLDDPSLNGDGTEVNGTATSAGASTLTDSTQSWTVNAYVGMTVHIIGGAGDNQSRTVVSNTATTITVNSPWLTALDATSQYTIGGYDVYHYTNWKSLTGSYDTLKQLWYIFMNLNAFGDYTIELLVQIDFDALEADQITIPINLNPGSSIWGEEIWREFIWGGASVFQDRFRAYSRFRAIRLALRNRKAGQPFQCNSLSIAAQDKNLFYGSAS